MTFVVGKEKTHRGFTVPAKEFIYFPEERQGGFDQRVMNGLFEGMRNQALFAPVSK